MPSLLDIRVGWYLARRQIRRSSRWTTGLIIFVMFLTFLNLTVITGILVGLIAGINEAYRQEYIGDAVISSLSNKNYVENSQDIITFLHTLPQVALLSPRYASSGTVEANYKTRSDLNDKANITGAQIVGIDPVAEDKLTHLSQSVMPGGAYLSPDDYDQILIGRLLLDEFSFGDQPGLSPLKNVKVGTKVRLTVGGASREVTVKGILKSKIDVATNVYMTDTQLRQLIGRDDFNVSQIAIRLSPGTDANAFRDLVKESGVAQSAKVQTFQDAIPNGVADISNTFAMLGNGISSIGLVVAAITIFIVIFINAITRRKFIGILKGIGISGKAIEISYIFQSLFYALIGSFFGLLVLYGFLVPSIAAHPIDFPFSDGILVAPIDSTMIRIALLVATTMAAGYIPARMIVRKNTLDSILGRN